MKHNCFIEETEDGRFVPVLALGFEDANSEDPDAVLVVFARAAPMTSYEEAEAFIDANAPGDDFT